MNFDNSIKQIPIEDILPNRYQPRISFDEINLKELADSIKEHGIIQPIVVRPLYDKYEIIAGERRYRAAKMAGLVTLPAIISNISPEESAEIAVVENIQREDLNAIEEAKSYKVLLDQGLMSQELLAKRMGLSQSAISNKIRLLSLEPEVQDAVMNSKISERHARTLLQVKSRDEQLKWLDRIINERITVKELDELLRKNGESNFIDNLKIEDTNINSENNIKQDSTIDDLSINNENINNMINLKDFLDTEDNSMVNKVTKNNDVVESLFDPIIEEKDFSKAITKIDELVKELQSDYDVKVELEKSTDEVKYILNIK